MTSRHAPAVWFPAVRTGTGTDVFTERLAGELRGRGLKAQIAWLPLRAEYAPWSVPVPRPPAWANVAHVNTWLHPRFLPVGLPIVATLHHAAHRAELDPYKGRLRSAYHRYWIRALERRTMARAAHVVAVSAFAAATARSAVLDREIRVIHNGVDVETFRPPVQRRRHRPFRLLYVGKWAPLKGVDLLAPLLRELGPDFELCYTGGQAAAGLRPSMPANMRDLGRLAGAEAVARAMQDADAFVFPSRSEGFGMAVVEAMACGLPVIATRGSALAELVLDGSTGILCGQDDIRAFAAAARRLAGEEPLHASIARAARERAVDAFSIERMVDAYIETCYRERLAY